jgi:ATP-dependent Lon protease
MEVIRLSGYTELEKMEIAKRFLVPKQRKETGIEDQDIEFPESGIQELVQHYTREAGVRNLEREIGNVCRKLARTVVNLQSARGGADNSEAEPDAAPAAKMKMEKTVIDSAKVVELLGPQKYREQLMERTNEVGVTVGLAWTEVGGSILTTEASIMEGRGRLTLTGKLGDVMQESAQAAMSFVRSRAHSMGLPRDFYRYLDIHLHVPEGAIPKDGPSAGITIATSITSALTSVPVRGDVAMTGEITVRGRVLPIGGLKEKLLAAHRQGIFEIVLPKENERDLPDIPENIRKDMKLHFVSSMDEVLKIALERELEMAPLAGMLNAAEIVARNREEKVTH